MTDKPAIADTVSVLVVEDEFLIRETLAENLADAGFEVHRAGHSAEAIELLELRWDGIHVLFTDVNMPGAMDGIDLAHHASRHWPKVALLVTSAVPHPKERVLPAGCRFIGKPYRTTQVVKHIRELARALAQPRTAPSGSGGLGEPPDREPRPAAILFTFRSSFVLEVPRRLRKEQGSVPETISIPVLRKAIENLRHQDAGLSSIDRCKLRCLEENLKVMLDLELASRVERIFCEYLSAAEFWQLRAEVACKVAGATVASNRACLNSTRAAISRSRKLLDVPRRA